MKWSILIIVLILLFTSGCGEWSAPKGNVSIKERIPSKADNPMIREFDKQLEEISDEESAEEAVSTFVDYVDSRIDRSLTGTTIQSLSTFVNSDTLKKIAQSELSARKNGTLSIMSVGGSDAFTPIDVGTLTDNINKLGGSDGVKVDDEIVSIVKTVVEESISNLNPEKKNGMTPLEALVISYSLISGDDGTAQENSINIPADKMNAFVETISN